jgi:acyl-CoA thioesterase I
MSFFSVCRLLTLAATVCAGPALAAPAVDPCHAPDETAGAVAALPKVTTVLQSGAVLDVLAVGSATMFGPDASLSPGTITSQSLGGSYAPSPAKLFTGPASDRAFPLQMVKALQSAVPGLEVKMTVRGGRSLLATDMLGLIRAELAAHHYDLVVWQTGTVEAVRNVPPGEFGQTLSEGAEAVTAAGANLVLVDPQFSRFLQTNSNLEPYEQGLQQAAAMPGVVLFHRYDLMRGWVNDSQIDLERTPRSDRQKVIETLHACLGKHLARLVLDSARS